MPLHILNDGMLCIAQNHYALADLQVTGVYDLLPIHATEL